MFKHVDGSLPSSTLTRKAAPERRSITETQTLLSCSRHSSRTCRLALARQSSSRTDVKLFAVTNIPI